MHFTKGIFLLLVSVLHASSHYEADPRSFLLSSVLIWRSIESRIDRPEMLKPVLFTFGPDDTTHTTPMVANVQIHGRFAN